MTEDKFNEICELCGLEFQSFESKMKNYSDYRKEYKSSTDYWYLLGGDEVCEFNNWKNCATVYTALTKIDDTYLRWDPKSRIDIDKEEEFKDIISQLYTKYTKYLSDLKKEKILNIGKEEFDAD